MSLIKKAVKGWFGVSEVNKAYDKAADMFDEKEEREIIVKWLNDNGIKDSTENRQKYKEQALSGKSVTGGNWIRNAQNEFESNSIEFAEKYIPALFGAAAAFAGKPFRAAPSSGQQSAQPNTGNPGTNDQNDTKEMILFGIAVLLVLKILRVI